MNTITASEACAARGIEYAIVQYREQGIRVYELFESEDVAQAMCGTLNSKETYGSFVVARIEG